MDNFKFYIKVTSTLLLRWLALLGLGILLSSIGFVIGFMLLGSATGAAYHGTHAGEVGAVIGMLILFRDDPWVALLIIGSVFFYTIYFLLANKVSLGFALFQLLENKLFPIIGNKVSGLLSTLIDKQPGLVLSLNSISFFKERLAKSANEDSSLNKIQRKAICYGLKKCRLDDIDFQQPNLDLPTLISTKVVQALQVAAQPTYKPVIAAVIVHAGLLVLALVLNR